MNIKEAIEKLKWLSEQISPSPIKEAIDTVVSEVEKPMQSDEQIEQYALENILDGVGIQSMINTKAWIAGATWMRDLIQERSKK